MAIKKRFGLCIVSLFSILTSNAFAANEAFSKSFSWASFELGPNMAVQSGGRTSYSVLTRWIPQYHLTPSLSFGLDTGVTFFKLQSSSKVVAVEYAATLSYQFEQLGVSLYLGGQSWSGGYYSTGFLVGPEISYQFSEKILHVIQKIYFSYTPVILPQSTIHEMSLGTGFDF